MQQEKPDLIVSDLLTELPVRRLIINVADMHPGRLTLLEALDIVDKSGIDANNFMAVMSGTSMRQKAMLLYAMAWVIARRAEPTLTFEEVCTYQLEVKGETLDDERERDKAEAIVAVAALAGVSPEEAKNMTITEVSAVTDLAKKKATKRGHRPVRRRRAG